MASTHRKSNRPSVRKAKTGRMSWWAGKDVVADWKENDTYGRTLGKVRQGPLDVNLQMVKDGLAWH